MPFVDLGDLEWNELTDKIPARRSILIGNGMSISCDSSFQYKNLLAKLAKRGISEEAKDVFKHLNTANFEQVMHLLDEAAYVAETYACSCGSVDRINSGADDIKKKLVESVADVHGVYSDHTKLAEERKDSCIEFLSPFSEIYSLNYDFLLYWVWVHKVNTDILPEGTGDGFAMKESPSVNRYTGLFRNGIRFLHGGLHLFVEKGVTKKYVYDKRTLLDQVKDGITSGRYPLFIAEGSAAKKRIGIRQNDYLSDCFAKFSKVGPSLMIFGSALGDSDSHLIDAVIENMNLKHLLIGYHGAPPRSLLDVVDSIEAGRKKRKRKPLDTLAIYRQNALTPWD